MIVELLREAYRLKAEKKSQSGYPTGSKLGKCTAQLQQLLYPSIGKPEAWQPRNVMAMEAGDIHAAWMNTNIRAAFPGIWGLREQPFFFPVPIGDAYRGRNVLETIEEKFNKKWGAEGRLWGTVFPGFYPPKIEETPAGKLRVGGLDQEINGKPLTKVGMILDPDAKDAQNQRRPILWVPTYIDGAIRHPVSGLTVVEEKSMSNFQFRRALLGYMDYEKRAQLAGMVTAMRVSSALWLCNRRETMHLAEISFRRGDGRTLVRLRNLGGEWDTFIVQDRLTQIVRRVADDGEEGVDEPLPGDLTWDVAEAQTPWDEAMVPELQQRVLDVVLFDGDPENLLRNYGPDFRCAKCGGKGHRECGLCHGTGLSPRAKTPKPCSRCVCQPKEGKPDLRPILMPAVPQLVGMRGQQRCSGECGGSGLLDRTELPKFPCQYCACAMACWASAGVERIIDSQPHYYITRTAFEQSGLTFTPVEAPVLAPAKADEDEEEAE